MLVKSDFPIKLPLPSYTLQIHKEDESWCFYFLTPTLFSLFIRSVSLSLSLLSGSQTEQSSAKSRFFCFSFFFFFYLNQISFSGMDVNVVAKA